MPLLLSRQWLGLRRAPVAARPLCRAIHFRARPAMLDDSDNLTPKPLLGGIVIPASVEAPVKAALPAESEHADPVHSWFLSPSLYIP